MSNYTLSGKRILMFSNKFFNYNEMIQAQIQEAGGIVELYDERPNKNVLTKIMLRYNIKLIRPAVERYYRKIIQDNQGKEYDFIFVIKSETITSRILQMLRQAYPRAKQILYLWDAVANVPDGEKKLPCYDRVLTFDPVDAEKYHLRFRPLFFAKDFEKHEIRTGPFTYAFAFIGTAHSVRPRVARVLQAQCTAQGKKSFVFLFLPHPVVYIYHKLTNPAYRKVRRGDIHFTPMTPKEIGEVYAESCCVLDVEHSKQHGLTMRTIEMLGRQMNLLTTNTLVKDYDFYNPRNICVIDRDQPRVAEDFWETDYEPIPEETMARYSLRRFVEEIFDVEGE